MSLTPVRLGSPHKWGLIGSEAGTRIHPTKNGAGVDVRRLAASLGGQREAAPLAFVRTRFYGSSNVGRLPPDSESTRACPIAG